MILTLFSNSVMGIFKAIFVRKWPILTEVSLKSSSDCFFCFVFFFVLFFVRRRRHENCKISRQEREGPNVDR